MQVDHTIDPFDAFYNIRQIVDAAMGTIAEEYQVFLNDVDQRAARTNRQELRDAINTFRDRLGDSISEVQLRSDLDQIVIDLRPSDMVLAEVQQVVERYTMFTELRADGFADAALVSEEERVVDILSVIRTQGLNQKSSRLNRQLENLKT